MNEQCQDKGLGCANGDARRPCDPDYKAKPVHQAANYHLSRNWTVSWHQLLESFKGKVRDLMYLIGDLVRKHQEHAARIQGPSMEGRANAAERQLLLRRSLECIMVTWGF